MEFSTFIIPGMLLATPILLLVLLLFPRKIEIPGFEKKVIISLFVFQLFVALLGFLRFESEVKMGFVLPFTSDTSGYFDFSLSLHWTRFLWSMVNSAFLIALFIYDGESRFSDKNSRVRFMFLAGSSFFSGLAVLSENIILSIMFVEMMFFLFHVDGLLAGEEESEQERGAFFRRAVFILFGLAACLVLGAFGVFETKAIILVSALIYAGSLIFSRHNFSSWSSLAISAAKMGAAFFLLNRVLKAEMAPELWFGVAVVFGLITIAFSLFSILSNRSTDSAFWLFFACFSYLFFSRFLSGIPQANFWTAFEGIGLLAAYAMALLVRFSAPAGDYSRRILNVAAAVFLLSIFSGAAPGLELASHELERNDSIVKTVLIALVSFFLALNAGKSVLLANETNESKKSFGLPMWAPAVFLFIVQSAAIAFFLHLSSTDLEGFFAGFARPEVQIHGAVLFVSILTGALAGSLIGSNSGFGNWLNKRNRRIGEFIPSVGSSAANISQRVILAPHVLVKWLGEIIAVRGNIISAGLERADDILFANKLYQASSKYTDMLSRAMRRAHMGNIRIYFFVGVLILLLGSILLGAGSQ